MVRISFVAWVAAVAVALSSVAGDSGAPAAAAGQRPALFKDSRQ